MFLTRLWADFNELDGETIWTSLRRTQFLLEGRPEIGERVQLFDYEGNTCEALVESIQYPIVFMKLDRSTWRPAGMSVEFSPPGFSHFQAYPATQDSVAANVTDIEERAEAEIGQVA